MMHAFSRCLIVVKFSRSLEVLILDRSTLALHRNVSSSPIRSIENALDAPERELMLFDYNIPFTSTASKSAKSGLKLVKRLGNLDSSTSEILEHPGGGIEKSKTGTQQLAYHAKRVKGQCRCGFVFIDEFVDLQGKEQAAHDESLSIAALQRPCRPKIRDRTVKASMLAKFPGASFRAAS